MKPDYIDASLNEVHIPFEKYQREEIYPKRIVKLENSWDDRQCDPIKLYPLKDSDLLAKGLKYSCRDGGHRVCAAKGLGKTHLPAMLYRDMEDTEAATLYSKQAENIVPMTRYDKHKAAVYVKDPQAVEIEDAIKAEGFTFTASRSRSDLYKIASVSDVYVCVKDYGVDELRSTLRAIRSSWPSDPRRVDGAFIYGLTAFRHYYDGQLDQEGREKLEGHPVNNLLNEAQGYQQRTRRLKVARAIRALTKARKLPSAPF